MHLKQKAKCKEQPNPMFSTFTNNSYTLYK